MDAFVPFDQLGIEPPGPWQNASPTTGARGSIVNADFFPAVQEEILNVQDEAGETRTASDHTQLLQAVRSGKLTYFADSGSADALKIAPRTSFASTAAGLRFVVLKGPTPNATATPTLTVGGPPIPLVKEDGTALAAGDLPASCLFEVCSDNTSFRVIGLRKSTVQALIPAATALVINSLSIVGGRLSFFNASAPWICPVGVTKVRLIGQAGGGGGGAGNGNAGAGGGGGNSFEGVFDVVEGATYAVTVGTGGSAGSGSSAGGNGGSTSFAPQGGTAFATALGGAGGGSGVNNSPNGVGISGNPPGPSGIAFPHGGFELSGGSALNGIALSGPVYQGGAGGGSRYASSTPGGFGNGRFNGTGYGAGGSGGSSDGSGSSVGGTGSGGLLIVEY